MCQRSCYCCLKYHFMRRILLLMFTIRWYFLCSTKISNIRTAQLMVHVHLNQNLFVEGFRWTVQPSPVNTCTVQHISYVFASWHWKMKQEHYYAEAMCIVYATPSGHNRETFWVCMNTDWMNWLLSFTVNHAQISYIQLCCKEAPLNWINRKKLNT